MIRLGFEAAAKLPAVDPDPAHLGALLDRADPFGDARGLLLGAEPLPLAAAELRRARRRGRESERKRKRKRALPAQQTCSFDASTAATDYNVNWTSLGRSPPAARCGAPRSRRRCPGTGARARAGRACRSRSGPPACPWRRRGSRSRARPRRRRTRTRIPAACSSVRIASRSLVASGESTSGIALPCADQVLLELDRDVVGVDQDQVRGAGALRERASRARARGAPRARSPSATRILRSRSAPPRLTVSTGQGAARTVRSATEPSSACLIPVSPRLPITIRSASARSAAAAIAKPGHVLDDLELAAHAGGAELRLLRLQAAQRVLAQLLPEGDRNRPAPPRAASEPPAAARRAAGGASRRTAAPATRRSASALLARARRSRSGPGSSCSCTSALLRGRSGSGAARAPRRYRVRRLMPEDPRRAHLVAVRPSSRIRSRVERREIGQAHLRRDAPARPAPSAEPRRLRRRAPRLCASNGSSAGPISSPVASRSARSSAFSSSRALPSQRLAAAAARAPPRDSAACRPARGARGTRRRAAGCPRGARAAAGCGSGSRSAGSRDPGGSGPPRPRPAGPCWSRR